MPHSVITKVVKSSNGINKDNWLTSKEAMKLTGYSRTTLWRLRAENKVRSKTSKTGRKILYEDSSLNSLFNENS